MQEKIRIGAYHWVFPGGSESAIVYNLLNNCSDSVDSTLYCKDFEGDVGNFRIIKENSCYLLINLVKDIISKKFDFFILPISSAETIHFDIIKNFARISKTKIIYTAGLVATEDAIEILKNEKPKYFNESAISAFWLDKNETLFRLKNSKKCIPETENEYLIVPSLFLKNLIKSRYKSNIFVVNHGVEEIKNIKRKQGKNVLRILFVGNGATRKGLDYLIDAYKQLKKEEYNVSLTVVSSWITDFKEKGILLLDHVSSKKMKSLYLTNDVLVLPSLLDGWGLVVTEAMSYGLPVIVSKNTGVKEIIKHKFNGFVVPIKNSKAIYSNMSNLANNYKLRNKISNNAIKTIKKITWKNQSEKFKKMIMLIFFEK
jgi:glycosyltransferase involved in cell wall biosynthesis